VIDAMGSDMGSDDMGRGSDSNVWSGGVLVGADELARLISGGAGTGDVGGGGGPPPLSLLAVRWSLAGPPGRDAYRAGHIPTAHFVDLDTQLAAPPGIGGRHPLPGPDAFQATMRSFGVFTGRTVVVYDAADSTSAARAWWLLRYYGHRDVRVLDGGYAAWTASNRPVETGPGPEKADPPGDFTAVPGGMPLIDADGAAKLAAESVLLDARAAARFRGEIEPVDPVAGHIPGAVSAPTGENVGPDDRFLDPQTLRTRFATLGVSASGSRPVGAYCGSGVTAAHEVLALYLAGIPASLYAGSWSDWITDPTRPVARGE
jgi:thiosulfate/3-mercaptopyruvate sulfurtransferase